MNCLSAWEEDWEPLCCEKDQSFEKYARRFIIPRIQKIGRVCLWKMQSSLLKVFFQVKHYQEMTKGRITLDKDERMKIILCRGIEGVVDRYCNNQICRIANSLNTTQTGALTFNFNIIKNEISVAGQLSYKYFFNQNQNELQKLMEELNLFYDLALRKKKQEDQNKQALLLKKCVKHSSLYTWKSLEYQNGCFKVSNVYESQKRSFLETLKNRKLKKSRVNNFYGDLGDVKKITKVFQLNQAEDSQLSRRYLTDPAQENPKQRLMQELKLTQSQVQQLIRGEIKHVCGKKIKALKLVGKELEHYHTLCSRLPNFDGIERHFTPKDKKLPNIVLTEVTQHFDYIRYLKNNSTVLSLNTASHLLFQITKVLEFFRNYNTVYNNLQPSNILIHKQLKIQVKDLSNTFDGKPIQQRKPVQKLPYVVINFEECAQNLISQSPDVYSFGMIAFRTLFRSVLHKTKKSSVNNFPQPKQLTTTLQYLQGFGAINLGCMLYLCLKATCQAPKITEPPKKTGKTRLQGKKKQITSTPYLDWVVISTGMFRDIVENSYM